MESVMLAHQGGWDEALLVMIPIAFMFAMLYLAKRRAQRAGHASTDASADTTSGPDTAPGADVNPGKARRTSA